MLRVLASRFADHPILQSFDHVILHWEGPYEGGRFNGHSKQAQVEYIGSNFACFDTNNNYPIHSHRQIEKDSHSFQRTCAHPFFDSTP